jgi:hypothetical protein
MYCQLLDKCPHTFNYMINHDLKTKALKHYLCNIKNPTNYDESNNLIFLKKILMCYDFPLFKQFFKDVEYNDIFDNVKNIISSHDVNKFGIK